MVVPRESEGHRRLRGNTLKAVAERKLEVSSWEGHEWMDCRNAVPDANENHGGGKAHESIGSYVVAIYRV